MRRQPSPADRHVGRHFLAVCQLASLRPKYGKECKARANFVRGDSPSGARELLQLRQLKVGAAKGVGHSGEVGRGAKEDQGPKIDDGLDE